MSTSQEFCFAHDPSKVEARRRAASRGGKRAGRGRPLTELSELRDQLADLYSSVLTDMVPPKTGAVLAQITNAQIRITEVELKVWEQQELEERLAKLETMQEREGSKRLWG